MEHAAAHDESGITRRPTLYVVATPIGNLADVSARALDVLRGVAAIAAEDTRITRRLLARHGIEQRLIPLHEHNERSAAEKLLALLRAGHSVAYACDAGTPGVSDPGALLVRATRDAGFEVTPIPGPSAVTAALSVAGMTGPQFLFNGFLPERPAARRRALASLAQMPCTLVFYEAPHRVEGCVADLAAVLGGSRRIVIARELTKRFESVHECALAQAGDWLAADPLRRKGEFVLVVEGGAPVAADDAFARRALEALLDELPLKQAVALAAKIGGGDRKSLYRLALELKKRDS